MAYLMKNRLCNRCPHFSHQSTSCNLGCSVTREGDHVNKQKWLPTDSAGCSQARKSFSARALDMRMIAAVDRNGAIGKDQTLPFKLPSDLKHFKKTTAGGVLIMGRKTFESLPGILPGRPHWVLSRRRPGAVPAGVRFFSSVRELLMVAMHTPVETKFWVIGGGEIYKLLLPYVHEIILSEVEAFVKGADTYFPVVPNRFMETSRITPKPIPGDEHLYVIRHLRDLSRPFSNMEQPHSSAQI